MNELTGAALDAAVAKAEGAQFKQMPGSDWGYIVGGETSGGKEGYPLPYSPSTIWAQGGPIIERERISLLQPGYGGSEQWEAGVWAFHSYDGWNANFIAEGPTALIAAMRAYVASKPDNRQGAAISEPQSTAGSSQANPANPANPDTKG